MLLLLAAGEASLSAGASRDCSLAGVGLISGHADRPCCDTVPIESLGGAAGGCSVGIGTCCTGSDESVAGACICRCCC